MRNKNIDIIKGIGIILIVAGHALSPYSIWFSSWFVQIFFIASGYLYNEQYSDAWGGGETIIFEKSQQIICSVADYRKYFYIFKQSADKNKYSD